LKVSVTTRPSLCLVAAAFFTGTAATHCAAEDLFYPPEAPKQFLVFSEAGVGANVGVGATGTNVAYIDEIVTFTAKGKPDGGTYKWSGAITSDTAVVTTNFMLPGTRDVTVTYTVSGLSGMDTVQLHVVKADLIQLGLDAETSDDEIALRKDGVDWADDAYTSAGDTDIHDPIWVDQDTNDVAECEDPVCFKRWAVPKIVGTKTKLRVAPVLQGTPIPAKLKVTAVPKDPDKGDPAVDAPRLVFGPADVVLSSKTITLPSMLPAGGGEVGTKVDRFDYHMRWEISLNGGTVWHEFQEMDQPVMVVSATPLTDYCSDVGGALPYDWNPLHVTAVRMDWACKAGRGGTDADDLPGRVQKAIEADPGFSGSYHFENPFRQLDERRPGDCISVANLAATALRLLGVNGRPAKAYCVHHVDLAHCGWLGVVHPRHRAGNDVWRLGFLAPNPNKFEGFFYLGDEDPHGSGNYPLRAWTIGPTSSTFTAEATVGEGKGKYLPVEVIKTIGVDLLRWIRHEPGLPGDFDVMPDVAWWLGLEIPGVSPDPVCTTWSADLSDDYEYDVVYDSAARTLRLHDGPEQPITADNWYILSSANPSGSVRVSVDVSDLPTSSTNGVLSIWPARRQIDVP